MALFRFMKNIDVFSDSDTMFRNQRYALSKIDLLLLSENTNAPFDPLEYTLIHYLLHDRSLKFLEIRYQTSRSGFL